jgi:hypothetical protein
MRIVLANAAMRDADCTRKCGDAGCGLFFNGQGGIRTHVTVSRKHTFQACALNHSATRPKTTTRIVLANEAMRDPDCFFNGQGEIRTHDTVAGMPVFETGAFNHSATCPTI